MINGRLIEVPFTHETKIERQAELWEYFGKIVLGALQNEHAHLVRYEDLCETPARELVRIADFLHTPRPTDFPTLQNMNRTPTVVLPDSAATAKPVFPMPAWQGRT